MSALHCGTGDGAGLTASFLPDVWGTPALFYLPSAIFFQNFNFHFYFFRALLSPRQFPSPSIFQQGKTDVVYFAVSETFYEDKLPESLMIANALLRKTQFISVKSLNQDFIDIHRVDSAAQHETTDVLRLYISLSCTFNVSLGSVFSVMLQPRCCSGLV